MIVPVRRELFLDRVGIDARETFGVAMCLLPVDISLRAYAIEAIGRVVAGHGLVVVGWRDVPVCAPVADVHIAQLVVASRDEMDEAAVERQLACVQESIERELASMGLCEDARLVSCSCRVIRYPSLDGVTPPGVSYPDLTGETSRLSGQVRAAVDA